MAILANFSERFVLSDADREALMKAGGGITCEAPRHPFSAMNPTVREGLLEVARRLDPLVLRWGR